MHSLERQKPILEEEAVCGLIRRPPFFISLGFEKLM
jgi:hypothetical protein